MAYDITVRQMPRQQAAVVRFRAGTADMGEHMGQAFGTVMAFLQSKGMQPAGPPIAQYEPVDGEFDTAAGFPVALPVSGEGQVEALEMSAYEAAVTEHVGPYTELSQAYAALENWLKENSRETASKLSWEQYLNEPSAAEAPRTLVFIPLKPR